METQDLDKILTVTCYLIFLKIMNFPDMKITTKELISQTSSIVILSTE